MKPAHWIVHGANFHWFDAIDGQVEGLVSTSGEPITALGRGADGRVRTTAASTTRRQHVLKMDGGEAHLRAVAAVLWRFA